MSEIQMHYQGFHPTEFTRAYLDSKMSQVQAQAPSGAQIYAMFTFKDKIFSANVSIFSTAGRLFASAHGPHMREVSAKLEARLRKGLKRWKPVRLHLVTENDFKWGS